MWPSTPATLQYSLTMAPSWRSLKRDTTVLIRASSRAFAATKERSTNNQTNYLDGGVGLGDITPQGPGSFPYLGVSTSLLGRNHSRIRETPDVICPGRGRREVCVR